MDRPAGDREPRLGDFFERLPEALFVLDLEGRILDANPRAATQFGLAVEALRGRQARDFVAEDTGAYAAAWEVVAAGGHVTVQLTGRRADGSAFPQSTTVMGGRVGERPVVFVLARDDTEQARLRADLAALTELARLDEAAPSPMEVADRALSAARRMVDADGGAVGLVSRRDHLDVLAEHELKPLLEVLERVLLSRVDALAEALAVGRPAFHDRRAPAGRPTELAEVANRLGILAYAVVPLSTGRSTGVLGLTWAHEPPPHARNLDVLETVGRVAGMAIANARLRQGLLARERSLDESEARYRALFEDSPEPLLLESPDGRIVDANRAAERLYRAKRDQLVGRSFTDLALVDAQSLARERRQLETTGRTVFQGTGVRLHGPTFAEDVEITAIALGGRPHRLALVRDVTDQQRLQGELMQAQKMEAIGQLVSGVAHELNNPLSGIVAFSGLLRDDGRLPEDLRHDAELLVQEADRTRHIVQNLLDFARQRPPQHQPIDLPELVRRTVELQAYDLAAGHVSVAVDVPDDLPPLDGDANQVQQVLLNLIQNAVQSIRSARPAGNVRISAREMALSAARERPFIRVSVTDDGPGVPEPVREQLFVPFFTTRDVGEGTGLGLPVSFGIVATHGGRLWFEAGPDGGAIFHLELPAWTSAGVTPTAETTESTATMSSPPRSGGRARGRVLVVDDEAPIRSFLTRVLTKAGHRTMTAADGQEALRLLRTSSVDALVIDHRMPEMDGLEVYRRAVEAQPRLARRTLIMSGDVLDPALHAFAETNGLPLLSKPFDLEAGVAAIEAVMRSAAADQPPRRG